jgi:hypothetical protein
VCAVNGWTLTTNEQLIDRQPGREQGFGSLHRPSGFRKRQ